MTQYTIRSVPPDGVPVLEVVSRGIPGEAGDVALDQGRLDAQHGVYRSTLFPPGFQRDVYDQGWNEVRSAPAANPLKVVPTCPPGETYNSTTDKCEKWKIIQGKPTVESTSDPEWITTVVPHARPTDPGPWSPRYNPARASRRFAPALTPYWGMDAPARAVPSWVTSGGRSMPWWANPAPPLPPGVPVYGPGYHPAYLTGQGCFSPYDCAPGEYCHQGLCMPDPWGGGGVGVTEPWEHHVGVTVEPSGNPNIGPLALALRASGFGQYLFPYGPPYAPPPGADRWIPASNPAMNPQFLRSRELRELRELRERPQRAPGGFTIGYAPGVCPKGYIFECDPISEDESICSCVKYGSEGEIVDTTQPGGSTPTPED